MGDPPSPLRLAAPLEWYFRFRNEEQRNQRIPEMFASLDAHTQHKAQQHEQRKQPHTLIVGDVIYNSWGYDHTNVDFYEVVKTSTNFVRGQSIARHRRDRFRVWAGYGNSRQSSR